MPGLFATSNYPYSFYRLGGFLVKEVSLLAVLGLFLPKAEFEILEKVAFFLDLTLLIDISSSIKEASAIYNMRSLSLFLVRVSFSSKVEFLAILLNILA
jgi:hypothetical protein